MTYVLPSVDYINVTSSLISITSLLTTILTGCAVLVQKFAIPPSQAIILFSGTVKQRGWGFNEQKAAEVEQLRPQVGGSTSRCRRQGAEMGLSPSLLYLYNAYTAHILNYVSLKLTTTRNLK